MTTGPGRARGSTFSTRFFRFLREATKHRIERVGGRAFVDVADDNDPQDVPGKQVRVHCLEVTYGDPRDRSRAFRPTGLP